MLIDLHIHTSPLSPCSTLSAEEAIETAKELGLDGICLVEHDNIWPKEEINAMAQKHNFLILRGMEVNTNYGHVMVFGLEEYKEEMYYFDRLKSYMQDINGASIVAHPFRDPQYLRGGYGIMHWGLNPEDASQRPIFHLVNGVEVFNGHSSPGENGLALEVARFLGLTITGGSDAHTGKEVGTYVTFFKNKIVDEEDLIREIKSGKTEARGLC
jgi:predicted metal-dependent phosphoesterase TrpH